MNNIFRTLSLALISTFVLVGCEQPVEETPVKVHLNKGLISNLPVGSTQTLVATLDPADAVATVVWSSSDEAVAVVNDEGEVTGIAPGEAVITAAVDQETATCKVVVTALKPEKIELGPATARIEKGTTLELQLVVTPSEAAPSDVKWESSNKQVASVADGVVTALSEGKTTITVKCNGGELAAVCQVEVVEVGAADKVLVSQIQMPGSLKLNEGEESKLEVVVLPEDATDKSVTFSSNNTECVTVDPQTGVVKAIKPGSATVTARANDGSGASAVCAVVVASNENEGSGLESVVLTVEGGTSDLQVGLSLQLKATFIPSDYKPNTVSWYIIENTELASLTQDGVITGVQTSKGTDGTWPSVIVTVNADGKESSHSIRVIPRQPDSIEIDMPAEGYIRVGQAWNFNPRVKPEGLGYVVYCSASLPGGKPHNDPYTDFVPTQAGTITGIFAVSGSENLVGSGPRRDVNLSVIPYWVESVSLPATQEMEIESTMTLTPTFTSDVEGVLPTYRDVKWASSNPSVATVNEKTGEITAIAAGETNITVTTTNGWAVPSGKPQKSATCVLTVKASEVALNVGDYFYSDGTWSTELLSGKKVVGIVFAKANAAASDPVLGKDYPGCTHGLVLGLAEYASQDFGSVSYSSGHGYYESLGYDPAAIVSAEKANGYGNTKAHKDLNASKPDFVALFNAETGIIATQTSAVATPSNASSWYVPSYREMEMINANHAVLNAALAAAGGTEIAAPYASEVSWDDNRSSDWYWTSTIWGKWSSPIYEHFKYAFDISKGGWTSSQQSFAKCKVRVVFAF